MNGLPDGTSNTIGFFERYARCGPGTAADWNSARYVSRIWAEDSDGSCFACPGAMTEHYLGSAGGLWQSPAWHMSIQGQPYPDKNTPPAGYPIDRVTGNSIYMTAIQAQPTMANCDPKRLQAMSPGGMLVVLMDGSVRSVNPSTSTSTLARAVTPSDGFVLGNDW